MLSLSCFETPQNWFCLEMQKLTEETDSPISDNTYFCLSWVVQCLFLTCKQTSPTLFRSILLPAHPFLSTAGGVCTAAGGTQGCSLLFAGHTPLQLFS